MREAIGWLRIMLPSSIIGEQQHFLCPPADKPQTMGEAGPGAVAARRAAWLAAAEVASGMERRGPFRLLLGSAGPEDGAGLAEAVEAGTGGCRHPCESRQCMTAK